jgi:hypothetical protein
MAIGNKAMMISPNADELPVEADPAVGARFLA